MLTSAKGKKKETVRKSSIHLAWIEKKNSTRWTQTFSLFLATGVSSDGQLPGSLELWSRI